MDGKSISAANDPHLRNIDVALERAAARARKIAKQSGTKIVVNRGGQKALIGPDDLPNSSNEASQ